MKFAFSSSLLLALAAYVSASTVADVKASVADIDASVSSLNTALQSTSLNYISALGIHNSAVDLDNKVKAGTTTVNGLTETVSDADTQSLITTLTGTEKNIASATDRLVALKSQFDGLGVSGLAKSDVNSLATDTKAFGDALVAKAATAEQADARALADKINADIANAVAAYP